MSIELTEMPDNLFAPGAPARGYYGSCRRKKRFETRNLADFARKNTENGRNLTTYACEECLGFHNGSTPKGR